MTSTQTVTLTSRLISLWFGYHALASLISIPSMIALASITGSFGSVSTTQFARLQHNLLMTDASMVSQLCVQATLAVVFYKCGPLVERFLLGTLVSDTPEPSLSAQE